MNEILFGDCRESLRALASRGIKAQTCVTSPPYFGLRDYGHDGQIGLEETPDQYIAAMVEVFRAVRDVLADDGTLWLNIGDSYAGSWGNAGGHNRGNGSQRQITAGSVVKDQAERNGSFVPPGARGFKDAGIKHKDLIGIPWMLAFALRADGWYLRQDIIWHKPNPMPESVRDRCTKAHEYVFLLSKSPRYYYDTEAAKEPAKEWGGRAATFDRSGNPVASHVLPGQRASQHRPRGSGNKERKQRPGADVLNIGAQAGSVPWVAAPTRNRRSVWTVATKPYKGAHFATFPDALITPCILAGSKHGDIVLDPFMGSGTTAAVAIQHGRQFLGCELNADYKPLQDERIAAARSALSAPTKVRKLAKDFTYRQLDIFEEAA